MLLSLFGEGKYELLSHLSMLPSHRSTQRWFSKFGRDMGVEEGILLNCSRENARKVIDIALQVRPVGADPTAVPGVILSCDAISLKPGLEIAPSGAVYGLVGDREITLEQFDVEKRSPEAFRRYLAESSAVLARAVHIYAVSFLDRGFRTLPLNAIYAPHGKATADIFHRMMEEVVHLKADMRVKVSAISFDGDNIWRKLLQAIHKQVTRIELYVLRANLSQQPRLIAAMGDAASAYTRLEEMRDVAVLTDPYHVVKCVRMAYVKDGHDFFVWDGAPGTGRVFGSLDCFRFIGIPSHVLDDDAGSKQDDHLPKLFFSFENLDRALACATKELISWRATDYEPMMRRDVRAMA
jgi:hypothetical protein